MADLTSRQPSWTDYLPGNWQQTINTSPVVNALSRMLNKPTPDLEGAARRQYGPQDELGSIADKEWLERSAAGTSWFERNPSAADGVNKLGLLANFLGPGVKLPGVPRTPGRYAMEYPGGRIDYKDMDGGVHVSGIYTNPEARGQGNAKQALQELIAAADAAKRPMSLEISPGAPGVDPARLRQWYESLGFSGPDYAMTRQPPPTGIRAYHGSPHDFDKFDISKIGTGEGAQAYGRGLYFAENEGVAKSYRDALAPKSVSAAERFTPEGIAGTFVHNAGGNERYALRELEGFLAEYKQLGPTARLNYEQAVDRIKSGNYPRGRMYEVNIKADPDQFLDWDKPLNQQPEVFTKMAPILEPRRIDAERVRANQARMLKNGPVTPEFDPGSYTGGMFARDAQALRDAGIPGIKYLDQNSRVAGHGTRNYVVFDDKLIEILRKYGLLPPVAAGTAAALNQQEPPL